MDYERLLVENLTTVERVVRSIARRHRLSQGEQEEFASQARLRLIENDFHILRRFERRSSLATYLTIVINRVFLDFRNAQWGRWRPSARAAKLGPEAVLLDRLITRDGHTVDEAIEILRINHRVPQSAAALRALWAALPVRLQATRVPEEEADGTSDAVRRPAEPGLDAETRALLAEALRGAVAGLPASDRLLLQLHFAKGVPLIQAAAHLRLSKATAHRRLARALAHCRAALAASGVDRTALAALPVDADQLADILDNLIETPPGGGRLKEPR